MAPKIHVYPSSLVLYLRCGSIGFYYCMRSDNNMQIYFWHVDILFSHHLLQGLHSPLNSSCSRPTCKGFSLDMSVPCSVCLCLCQYWVLELCVVYLEKKIYESFRLFLLFFLFLLCFDSSVSFLFPCEFYDQLTILSKETN